jgi:hypothetical protein
VSVVPSRLMGGSTQQIRVAAFTRLVLTRVRLSMQPMPDLRRGGRQVLDPELSGRSPVYMAQLNPGVRDDENRTRDRIVDRWNINQERRSVCALFASSRC